MKASNFIKARPALTPSELFPISAEAKPIVEVLCPPERRPSSQPSSQTSSDDSCDCPAGSAPTGAAPSAAKHTPKSKIEKIIAAAAIVDDVNPAHRLSATPYSCHTYEVLPALHARPRR